jgi:hypothetical protein
MLYSCFFFLIPAVKLLSAVGTRSWHGHELLTCKYSWEVFCKYVLDCSVRVPVEIIKQRRQVFPASTLGNIAFVPVFLPFTAERFMTRTLGDLLVHYTK